MAQSNNHRRTRHKPSISGTDHLKIPLIPNETDTHSARGRMDDGPSFINLPSHNLRYNSNWENDNNLADLCYI